MGALAAFAALVAAQERHDTNLLRLTTIAADTETVVIGSETFTCVAADPEAFEFVPGANADASATNLAATINADNTQDLTALAIASVGVLIWSNRGGSRRLACTETLAGANNAWAAAAMYGGSTRGIAEKARAFDMVAFNPNATEVALGQANRVFGFEVGAVIVDVRDTNGDSKAWDGATTINGRRVTVDNTGSTDLVATDTVTILAIEA